MQNIQQGLENLKRHIKIAPEAPGVYRMLGENDEVLYVGKAKNIKKRIVAYSHFDKLPIRLQRMVSQIKRMEFIIVENEAKALLMENELIKELEPKYNILLKDDKTFPHLVIDVTSKFPSLRKYRGKRQDKNKYFGPFASVTAVNSVLDIVQKAFLLRSCRDGVFNNRQRPCLMYQIKRCSAPCVGRISEEDYKLLVKEAIDFLEGKNTKLQEELSQQMNEASERMDYETALVLRDRIRALASVQRGNNVEYADIKSVDMIALVRKNNLVCIQVFFIRSGQNCGNAPYFPKQIEDADDNEILEAFLSSFYSSHIPPKEIVLSQEIENKEFLEKALSTRINTYQKGNKAHIINMVKANAEASIDRKIAEQASVKSNLEEMVKWFDLPRIPQRIEIYDNSHNQGTFAIGAMVVATPDGFDKKSYRQFNIKESDFKHRQEENDFKRYLEASSGARNSCTPTYTQVSALREPPLSNSLKSFSENIEERYLEASSGAGNSCTSTYTQVSALREPPLSNSLKSFSENIEERHLEASSGAGNSCTPTYTQVSALREPPLSNSLKSFSENIEEHHLEASSGAGNLSNQSANSSQKIINQDDFLMMKEVLLRRFARMTPENKPDVILLDGGLGQLHAVHEALKDFDLSGIAIIAISKGPDRNAGKEFYHQLGKESFSLPFQSPIAFYLQNLRDEAHRFAIGTHRARRAKSISKSRLDEIEGIGARRKRDLLNYFGSVEEISQSSVKDLQKVEGISKKTAEKIYNYFHIS